MGLINSQCCGYRSHVWDWCLMINWSIPNTSQRSTGTLNTSVSDAKWVLTSHHYLTLLFDLILRTKQWKKKKSIDGFYHQGSIHNIVSVLPSTVPTWDTWHTWHTSKSRCMFFSPATPATSVLENETRINTEHWLPTVYQQPLRQFLGKVWGYQGQEPFPTGFWDTAILLWKVVESDGMHVLLHARWHPG